MCAHTTYKFIYTHRNSYNKGPNRAQVGHKITRVGEHAFCVSMPYGSMPNKHSTSHPGSLPTRERSV